MKVFIDDFTLIRVETTLQVFQISLTDHTIHFLKREGNHQFFTTERPIELHIHDHITINQEVYPLYIGLVTLTKEFERRFRYDGLLGVDYQKSSTRFAVFSPVAKEIYVVIDDIEYPMVYHEPIWERVIDGDFHGKKYVYKVRLVDQFDYVHDPYTVAAATDGSYIIDWSSLVKINPSPISLKNYTDAVIYEGHIRDLTIQTDVPHAGLFDGMIEYSKTFKGSVLNYIKRLGVTHLQLLPIFDFDGVDEKDKGKSYNWGYNPVQYFALEGWFAKDPDQPTDRIEAMRRLVNEAHQLMLGVNMDVVYNHVFSRHTFAYDYLVPGYFYRHDKSQKGTNASYCGNDVETRNYMVRKLIVDSLIHWVENYQIDGFRFDLMGLMDLDTMHLIEKELKKRHPSIMLYGEGWNMMTEVPPKQRPHMGNQALFPSYAHFNDFFRNTMKGELHGPGLGFTMGNQSLILRAMDAIVGSPQLFNSPNQSINYVECHDNMTYFDKLLQSCGYEKERFKDFQDFANHVIAISQGIPFYHAGQEFYRSKKGVENSYNSSDEINQIHWNTQSESAKKLKAILKIRKRYSVYRKTKGNEHVSIYKDQNLIKYVLEDKKYILTHYLKHDHKIEKLPLDGGSILFYSQDIFMEENHMFVDKPGVYIILIHKV